MNTFDNNFIQVSREKVKEEKRGIAWSLTIYIALYIVLLFFFIFFTWYTVFISTHKFYEIYGISMKDTLNSEISNDDPNPDQHSYVGLYVDRLGKIKTGEIIVLNLQGEKNVVKRLIAQEDDYVTILRCKNADGEDVFCVYRIESGTDMTAIDIENFKLDETSGSLGYKIFSDTDWFDSIHNDDNVTEITEKGQTHSYEGRFFRTYLSDHGSTSQRYEHFVSNEGVVFVKVPKDCVFYLGDNRGHSTDGRERGFAKRENVVGRCEFIVKDTSFGGKIWAVIEFYFQKVTEFFAR